MNKTEEISNLTDKSKWRIDLENQYALICKFCSRKVLDPDKRNINQVFTKSKCPHCFSIKGKKINILC